MKPQHQLVLRKLGKGFPNLEMKPEMKPPKPEVKPEMKPEAKRKPLKFKL